MGPAEFPEPGGVREVEYSGDVALEVWGRDRAELLANATRGLCGLMTWSPVEPVSSRRIEVRAPDLRALVVDWLSAVILAAATHAELYAGATMEVATDVHAAGTLFAAPLDAARHELRFDVKAATYHDVLVEETGVGYRARVVFDL
ncbi:MAG TPA: archease [Dongiaceae bacterium]|nr:archease [Dongiaceae bacterium]